MSTLTMSTRDIYRNIPAVIANIQFLTAGSVDTARPIYNPTIAVREDRKLKAKARPNDSPLVNKMAKSPET